MQRETEHLYVCGVLLDQELISYRYCFFLLLLLACVFDMCIKLLLDLTCCCWGDRLQKA